LAWHTSDVSALLATSVERHGAFAVSKLRFFFSQGFSIQYLPSCGHHCLLVLGLHAECLQRFIREMSFRFGAAQFAI
jgi:hypothetical protein